MTAEQWNALLQGGPVLLDGATGSNLMKAGMPVGVCPEAWIAEHPESILELQKRYVQSGAQILYAPTFTANRARLADYGMAHRLEELNTTLVKLSRQAAGGAFVAGDLTMTGKLPYPMGSLHFEEMVELYKEQVQALVNAGVDLLVIETMMNLQETKAALTAARECGNLPVMVTMTFDEAGRTLYGTSCEAAAVVLASLGADALGVNCSEGPAGILPLIQRMRKVCSVPLIAKPNAGKPETLEDGSTQYHMTPEEFAGLMQELYQAGAVLLGGCCGTAPEYIAAMKACMEKWKRPESCSVRSSVGTPFFATERDIYPEDSLENCFEICAAKNPELAKELAAGEYEAFLDLLEEAEDSDMVEINFDLPDTAPEQIAACLTEAIEANAGMSRLPWSFSSRYQSVLAAAKRVYPGVAFFREITD